MDVNTDELEEYRDELDGLINGLKSLSECTKENVQELIDQYLYLWQTSVWLLAYYDMYRRTGKGLLTLV